MPDVTVRFVPSLRLSVTGCASLAVIYIPSFALVRTTAVGGVVLVSEKVYPVIIGVVESRFSE